MDIYFFSNPNMTPISGFKKNFKVKIKDSFLRHRKMYRDKNPNSSHKNTKSAGERILHIYSGVCTSPRLKLPNFI